MSRKQLKPLGLRIRNGITHEDVRKLYNKSSSPSDNLTRLGLEVDCNKAVRRRNSTIKDLVDSKPIECAAFIGLASDAQLETMKGANCQENNPKRRKMSDFDKEYINNCINKYKDDYKAMERDIQLNYFQHSESKLRKMHALFDTL